MVETIPQRLLRQAELRPSSIAYQAKVNGRWQPTTWRTFVDQCRTAARAMIALGLPRGGKVAILGFNRPEWTIFDHASMMCGAAPAGIYTTCSPDEVQYIIHHSEAHLVLVEDAAQLAKVEARRAQLPLLQSIVMMRGSHQVSGSHVLTWEDFLAKAAMVPESAVDQRVSAIEQAELATLIYTSGTTGPPKGVMLSHQNLAWTSRTLNDVGGGHSGEVSVSYLPLSHIAEQMATIHGPVTSGGMVYYAESIEKLGEAIKEARPTLFFGVPRIWEKFHAGVSQKLGAATGVKKRLAMWAMDVAGDVNALRDRDKPLPRLLALQYELANKLVLSKVKAAIGFDRARTLISGAAPIAPDVLAFFAKLDLPIREIYGQSEDTGPTSYNLPGRTKLGSVGATLPGIEVRIADDGEICVRGPNVFLGYFKEPEATTECLHDGWLLSGDLGAFDPEGFLTITGRKKEIIITAGGKNIAPKNIEAAIKQSPFVGEAVVIGDRRKFLTVLITLAEGVNGDARSAIQAQIDAVNETLARVEQVKKFAILERPFGIDSGELTPTLKIKRKVVSQKYAAQIEAMYADDAGREA